LNTGEGNDTITGHALGGIYNIEDSILDTGDGNDLISVFGHYNGIDNRSNLTTGDGNDTIESSLGTIFNYGGVFLGDGNDILVSGIGNSNLDNIGIDNIGTINAGNGNDSITSLRGKFFNRGNVFLGEGNDSITADTTDFSDRALENFGFIGTGDGKDTIITTGVIYNEGIIETGNGDDSIIVDGGVDDLSGTRYGIYNNRGAINMGDGNDSIIANEGFQSGLNSGGAWFLGEGDDYIKGYGSGDFYGGNGNDILELTPGTYTLKKWADSTGESVVFTKGNGLMITSEFEQLIAGGITYNFTSLTEGQIITVA
jgi:hypothetical protein